MLTATVITGQGTKLAEALTRKKQRTSSPALLFSTFIREICYTETK